MSWVESKYINLLSNRIVKFKAKSGNLWTMRCPYCGDSEKNPNKTRGYIFEKKNKYIYHCHNCSISKNLNQFLKDVDLNLYENYIKDSFLSKPSINQEIKETKQVIKYLDDLPSIASLSNKHYAKKYILERQIPEEFHEELFFCETFKEWTNKQLPDKFESLENDESRIIIPFFDKSKKYFGFQGRSLNPYSTLRYITIILAEKYPKIYGLDKVDFNRLYYVLEGPFDSMFIDNSIASAGGKISSELNKIKCNIENAVIIYDNENRNKDVMVNLHKAVKANYKVVIWPESVKEKDINEMILASYTKEKILKTIKENTFQGLEAELKYAQWSKW